MCEIIKSLLLEMSLSLTLYTRLNLKKTILYALKAILPHMVRMSVQD